MIDGYTKALEYQSVWCQQGAQWEVYARKVHQRGLECYAAALELSATSAGDAAEAFASLVPVFERVVEAFAAIDPRTLEVEMTPFGRTWSWIKDTYYRWAYR